MSAQWRTVADQVNEAQFGATAGFTGVERRCVCGAPWVVLWSNQDGAVGGCEVHPDEPGHQEFTEKVTGPPLEPLDIAAWAVEAPEAQADGPVAAAALEWLRAWTESGLEALPRVRRDLQVDGGTAAQTAYRAIAHPIAGDTSRASLDHLDLGLRYLRGILES